MGFRKITSLIGMAWFTVGVAPLWILTAQWPWVQSVGQNLKPFTGETDVSKWANNSHVGCKFKWKKKQKQKKRNRKKPIIIHLLPRSKWFACNYWFDTLFMALVINVRINKELYVDWHLHIYEKKKHIKVPCIIVLK